MLSASMAVKTCEAGKGGMVSPHLSPGGKTPFQLTRKARTISVTGMREA